MALGVGEEQEFLEFLVGLDDVSGEVGGDWRGLVFLAAGSSAADRRGRAGATGGLSAPGVLTGTFAGWSSWPLSRVSRPWHHRVRSPSAAGRDSPGCPRRNVSSWGRERAGGRIRLAIEGTPVQRGARASAVPAARSYDRHLTVGLAVTGRHPASRTGPERNMPAPLTPARRAQPRSCSRTFCPWRLTAVAW